jgi:hypothetical protein
MHHPDCKTRLRRLAQKRILHTPSLVAFVLENLPENLEKKRDSTGL